MKVLIFPQHHSRVWASSRFRAHWLEDVEPDTFEVWTPDSDTPVESYDAVMFQKRSSAVDIMNAQNLKKAGIPVIYDLTDPLWWWKPEEVTAMMSLADVITVSSQGLQTAIQSTVTNKPVRLIPDRMRPDFHPTVREHRDEPPVKLVWFGMSLNRPAIVGALPILTYMASTGHEFVFRLIDEATGQPLVHGDVNFPIEYVPWTLETIHANLIDCDIAVLPPFPGPWGQMKSNNKAVSAMWAGLPVVDGYNPQELGELLTSVDKRRTVGQQNRMIAERDYDIADSVEQFKQVVREVSGD